MAGVVPTGTALKMKDTNKTTSHKNRPLSLAAESSLKKPSENQSSEVINMDTFSARPAKKGPDKMILDKENLVNSAPEEEEEEGEGEDDEEVTVLATVGGSQPSAKQKDVTRRKKINDFIADRTYRMRSFMRRRSVPLTRTLEMDVQCGTKSFILQINTDTDEAVFCGSNDLVKSFLSPGGLKLADINTVLVAGKCQARPKGQSQNWEHDYYPAPDDDNNEDEDDEDFFDTVKSRRVREKEARAESARRLAEVEYLKNPVDRMRRFKSAREGIFAKLKEIDSVCGSTSFAVVISVEKDYAFYQGSDHLVSQFFTVGLGRASLPRRLNVRRFEENEVDVHMCAVPQCVVSRNTLGKWRLAAIEMFGFPPELPLTLHLCPEGDRDKWIAEIDMDPVFKSKFGVCSLHFRDGYPTPENPHPTELLTDTEAEPVFRGRRPDPGPATGGGGGSSSVEAAAALAHKINVQLCQSLLDSVIMLEVNRQIDAIETERAEALRREERRRKDILALRGVKFCRFISHQPARAARKAGKMKKKPKEPIISIRSRFQMIKAKDRLVYRRTAVEKSFGRPPILRVAAWRGIKCRFCPLNFLYTKSFFQHVRHAHVAPIRRRIRTELEIRPAERRRVLSKLYPPITARALDPKKKYVCAVCKSVCDLYGLFLHMKEVHHGLLCQYCLKLFKKVRDLENHLNSVHGVPQRYYHNFDMFKQYSGSNVSLACGECSAVLSLSEADGHTCAVSGSLVSSYMLKFECPACRQPFPSQEELESHIVNMWCSKLRIFDSMPSVRDIQVVYRILTGNTLELPEEDTNPPIEMTDTEINALLEVDIGGGARVESNKSGPAMQPNKKNGFSCTDRNILLKYVRETRGSAGKEATGEEAEEAGQVLIEELPAFGTIFCGIRSKGITNNIKKEFKDRGRTFDIGTELGSRVTEVRLDETMRQLKIQKAGRNFILELPKRAHNQSEDNSGSEHDTVSSLAATGSGDMTPLRMSGRRPARKQQFPEMPAIEPIFPVKEKPRHETRQERIARLKAEVEQNLVRVRSAVDAFDSCLFCQQCKTVGVDAQFLLSHLHIIHPADQVGRWLGESAQAAINRLKRYLRDIRRKEMFFNYLGPEEKFSTSFYRCSYCPTTDCSEYADLFRHTAEAHNTKVLTCNICQNIFLNYGSLISHLCSGPPTSTAARARFSCKMCHRVDLASFLDFQKHIRQQHDTCEICFQMQADQTALHAHCTSHDQDLMCMKCFVTFEKADSFRKHMFWKHSGEQAECPACHAPTWPHVYHFCLPHLPVACHTCDLTLPNAAAFKVHQRQHSGRAPHICLQPGCDKSFISKSLLWKHQLRRHPVLQESVQQLLHQRRLKKDVVKFGASGTETLDTVYSIVEGILTATAEAVKLAAIEREKAAAAALAAEFEQGETVNPPAVRQESVLDAAIRSIMPEPEEEPPPSASPAASSGLDPDRAAVQATIAGRTYTEANSWQAGIDALLAGASLKIQSSSSVPAISALLPADIFQTSEQEEEEEEEEEENDETQAPVIGGLWNQDLMFVSKPGPPQSSSFNRLKAPGRPAFRGGPKIRGLPLTRGGSTTMPYAHQGGVMGGGGLRMRGPTPTTSFHRPSAPGKMKVLEPTRDPALPGGGGKPGGLRTQWDLDLSESSEEDDAGTQARKQPSLKARQVLAPWRTSIMDHDYCYAAFMMSQRQPEDTTEMEKIASNVAFGGNSFTEGYEHTYMPIGPDDKKKRKKKRKEKKKKKRKRKGSGSYEDSSTESDVDMVDKQSTDMFGIKSRMKLKLQSPAMGGDAGGTVARPFISGSSSKKNQGRYSPRSMATTPVMKRLAPKPKYHTPDVAKTGGVVAGTARPNLNTDSDDDSSSRGESDLDVGGGQQASAAATDPADGHSDEAVGSSDLDTEFEASGDEAARADSNRLQPPANIAPIRNRSSGGGRASAATKPVLKLKIKLPPQPKAPRKPTAVRTVKKRRRRPSAGAHLPPDDARPLSKKMRESLALNQPASSEDENGDDSVKYDEEEEEVGGCGDTYSEGAKNVDSDKLYCYCQCPHDEVSEMIGCDAPDCRLEWFHFECVNILVPPEGKWYCPECTKRYGL